MKRNRSPCLITSLAAAALLAGSAQPVLSADYDIDPAHSFIQFRIKHLGYSWLQGRFNKLSGTFSHESDNAEGNSINVDIDPASIDTNHAERDKHLRGEDFFDVKNFPKAGFKSTKYSGNTDSGILEGELTLHGVTKPVRLEVQKVGEGPDPWGSYRAGFMGTTDLTWKEFNMPYDLGLTSEVMYMELTIEGIRQK